MRALNAPAWLPGDLREMSSSQILYWRGSGEVRADVLMALSAAGYSVETVGSFDEVLTLVDKTDVELLVVDASTGEGEASNRVVELSGAYSLHHLPVIFLSYQASKRSEVLRKEYQTFLPVDVPLNLAKLLEQIRKLVPLPSDTTAQVDQESDLEEQAADFDLSGPSTMDEPEPARKMSESAKKQGKTSGSYRIQSVREKDPTQLVNSYGGETLYAGSSLAAFNDALLLPDHPTRETLERLLGDFTKHNEWLGLHVRRCTFVSGALATSLGLSAQQNSFVRTLAILLQWGFLDSTKNSAITVDPFSAQQRYELEDLVQAFKRSAEHVKNDLQDPGLEHAILEIASLISSEIPRAVTLEEQVVLGSDLINRATWNSGLWDHFGNHRAIRRMRENFPAAFHPKVLGAIARVLAEAAANSELAIEQYTDRETERDTNSQVARTAIQEAVLKFGETGHLAIQIADLKPGMLLVRPLLSWDGKVILEADTSLDQELIERLWQLATIRPFKPPVLVAHPEA